MYKVYLKLEGYHEAPIEIDSDTPVLNEENGCFYFQKQSETVGIFPVENVLYICKATEAATRVDS